MSDTQFVITPKQLEDAIENGVQRALIRIGVDANNPIEMQKDFQHVRDGRQAVEAVKRKGFLTIMTLAVTGAVAIFVLGIKQYFGVG